MNPARRTRAAAGLWVLLAVVVWNGLYDLRITLGVRDYLMQQAIHEAGRGPAVVMSDLMQATVRDAALVASLWAAIVLAAGLATIRLLTPRVRTNPDAPPGRPWNAHGA